MNNKPPFRVTHRTSAERLAANPESPAALINGKVAIIVYALDRLADAGEAEAAKHTPYQEVTKNRGVLLYMDVGHDGDQILDAVYTWLDVDEQRQGLAPVAGEVDLEGFETYEINAPNGVRLLETRATLDQNSGLGVVILWGSLEQ
jgi:hypothetical protein